MGPLLYLTLCSLRNRMRVRLKRLKEPRYLIGLIVGVGYLWTVFLRPRTRSGAASVALFATIDVRSAMELAGAALLFLLAATAWLSPSKRRPALSFTRADIQFLFPAPLTRKELLRYKVVRSQVSVLIGSAFMTLVFRRGNLADGWMFFAGMAVALTILNLYITGVSLSRGSLGVRRWLPVALAAGATIVLAGTVAVDWGTLSSMASGTEVIRELGRLATTGAAGIVFSPFRAVSRLPLAETPAAFLRALPGALLILMLSYLWVIRSDVSFEEGSAELAEKIASIRKGPQPSARVRPLTATPFRLSIEGRPEMAILWKNLISVGRYVSLRTLFRFLPLLFVLGVMLTRGSRGGVGSALAGICGLVYFMTIFLGPQLARNDLRQDLRNLDVLKTWPVSGTTIVRGEVMAPAVLLTVIAWLCALDGLIFAASLKLQVSWVVAAALLAPGLIVLQLLAQNAIAVLWPSWVVTGPARARGIDVMGQRLLMMLGLLLVLVVAVLPAGIAAVVTGLGIYYLTRGISVIAPAIVAAGILLAEAFFVSRVVGKLLDRTDVSAIDAVE